MRTHNTVDNIITHNSAEQKRTQVTHVALSPGQTGLSAEASTKLIGRCSM